MSVSLTRILANAGIPVAMNALVPGSGMADMFIRNAGTGIARGLVNQPGGGPQRVGGPGSPEGAMPTRKFGSTRETVGELKSGFKDWLVDPLQAKKEKREQERDTALAYRLGITGGEFSLIHRPAMSLIKKRTGDVQTNIMILQFRVQQFMARNLSAIASTLGVQKSKLLHEHPDPNKSWFGNLLSSFHKDLQQNPIFSTLESVGKHAINIGSILNPFTLGSRAKKGVKSFGEFMQRLAMGKEGFEMMKDPERLYEKAGLKQDFQTKSVNLMKINNEYQKHQLNMLFNILGATKEILGIFGGSYQNQKLDLTHDEFEGTLKTHRQLRQAEGMRAMKLETTYQAATRRSIIGRVGSLIGGVRNIGYSIAERARPKQASKRDLYALDYMYNTPGFFDYEMRGLSDNLDQFIDQYRGRDIDWYNKRNSHIANEFKFWIEDAIEHPKPGHERQARDLEEAWELSRNQSAVQVSLASTHNAARRVGNIFANWTGNNIANTDPLSGLREARGKFETYTRFGGDLSMAGTQVGSGGERAVNEYHNTGILPAVLRSIPVLGALFGMRQQRQIGGLQTRYEESMRSPYRGPDEDKIFGYGQGATGRTGGGTSLFSMNVKIVDINQSMLDKIKNTLDAVLTTFSFRFGGVLAAVINTDFKTVFLDVERQFVTDLFNKIEEWNKSKNLNKALPIAEKQPPIRSAHGNIFSGGNISDYSGEIVDKPTLFKYDDLQKFAKGNGLMGEDGPEGVFPLERRNGKLGIGAPSIMRVVLVDINGNPLPISLPQNQIQMQSQTEKKKLDDVSSKKSEVKPLRAGTDSQMASLLSRDQVAELLRNLAVQKELNSKFVARKISLIPLRGIVGKFSDLFSGTQTDKKKIEDTSSKRSDFKPLRAGFDSQMASLMSGGFADSILRDLSSRRDLNLKFMRKLPSPLFQGTIGKLGNLVSGITGTKPKEKKQIDENDNTTTTAERQKSIEEKQKKKEEAKKAEEQKVNEEDKKSTLHRIADLLDPRSAVGKLIDKYREHKEKKKDDGFKLPFDISSWISKLGIGLIGNELFKMLPEGFFTGEDGILSKIWKFTKDSVGEIFGKAKKYVEENAFGWFKGAWEHFKEHPLLDAGILMTMFPGTVGKLITKIAGKALTNPASIPAIIGIGGMVYNLVDAFSKSKDEAGEFSIGKFLAEFFLGSDGGVVGTLSKAASWGWMGAKIGAMFGGVGALPGMLVGTALGALVGSTESRDEQGNFSWGKFFKNLAVGNDAAGGLENGGKQFLKWGLVGGAVGGPVGFFLSGAIGGLLGIIGADGFKKIYQMGEQSGQTVAKFFKWEKGSFAYKAATCGAANSLPWVGALVFGALGSILDLGSMLIKGLWGWVKSFLPQSVIDRIEGKESEYEKKFNEENKVEVKATELDADSHSGVSEREYKMNVNEKDATYINEAKTENEKLKRYREIEAKNNRKKHWGTEATTGVNGKKYNPEKYIALKEKWAEEDKKINEIYSQEIDVPWTAPGIKDFNTTPDNAQQYKDLYEINPDDALKFAKGVFDKQEEEKRKREAERESALKKIEVGSSPDDLKMDACRKSSCVPAAIAAKIGVGGPDDDEDDDMGSGVDVSEISEKFKGATAGELAKRVLPKPNVYDLTEDTTQMQPKREEVLDAHGKMMEQIREGQRQDDKDGPIYKKQSSINRYNAEMNANPDLGALMAGIQPKEEQVGPQLPSPNSTPKAAGKAAEDSAKKSKGKSESPVTPTGTPAIPSGEPVAAAQTPDATPASSSQSTGPSGQLNWLENIISQTIQGAFKFGGSIVGAVKTAYNNAQQTNNGGPGGSSNGAVGSWGGGFSNAEYLPGKPGQPSLGTNFITAKPKNPKNRPGRNNNPLNVKVSPKGADKADEGGHRIFGNVDDGVRGSFWQLQRYINGTVHSGKHGLLNTARKIIPVWAPVDDGNKPDQYLAFLQKRGVDIDAQINLNSPASLDLLAKLMSGMSEYEGWGYINPEEIKKVLTYGNAQGAPGTTQVVNGGGNSGPIPNASPAVQKYLAIMERNTHGSRYEMSGRRDNPGIYDCSSFVSRSLREAGYKIPTPSPTTENLGAVLKANGFQYYPLRMNEGLKQAPAQLQPGDILLNRGNGWHNHVETYWGNNKIVGAHSTRPANRKDDEVSVKAFYSTGYPGFYRLISAAGGYTPNDLLPSGSVSKWNVVYPGYGQTDGAVQDLSVKSSTDLRWPADSTDVTSGMGPRNPSDFAGAQGPISHEHGGTDIHAPSGSSIYSAMSGKIVGTSPNYGTVEIEHPDGWRSKYLHMKKFFVKAGQSVKAGDTIGEAGGIGKDGMEVFTPHLHFEMLKDGANVDPEQVFAQNKSIRRINKKQAIDDASKKGLGGPDFTPRINKQMNEYLDSKAVGGPEETVKSDNRIIAELKKLQVIMLGVMKAAGKPAIAVSAPQEKSNPQNQVDESGQSDAFTDTMFNQIGGLLPNLNVSLTGLGTAIT